MMNDLVTIRSSIYKNHVHYFTECGFIVLDWTAGRAYSHSTMESCSVTFDQIMTLNSEAFIKLSSDIQRYLQINGYKKCDIDPCSSINDRCSSSDDEKNDVVSSIEIAFQMYWSSILFRYLPENIDAVLDLNIFSCNIKRIMYDILADRMLAPSDYDSSVDYIQHYTYLDDAEVNFLFELIGKTMPAFEDVLMRHFIFTKEWKY